MKRSLDCCSSDEASVEQEQQHGPLTKKVKTVSGSSRSIITSRNPVASEDYDTPTSYAQAIYQANGFSSKEVVECCKSQQRTHTPDMIDGYTMELSMACREGDLETVKKLHQAGTNLDCCNRFGQHVLHLACLRGHLEIVQYLVQVAKVDVTIVDDQQRTPLHDACWASQVNFDIVKLIIKEAPQLVLFPDKRGFTPFDYTRQPNWEEWKGFLEIHQHMLALEDKYDQ
ncbi:unnamed protein product [Cylindrotheca closterium]|uniref:Uncharacterized protein n=1 Tax=Cylindrotheca closterium TaxID=2856 RepID=A0AAD2G3A1_9STRA|nr:unnamed protein product [Cylindrotheca closterium]